jgi:sugar phosphate isomerase/epimerase
MNRGLSTHLFVTERLAVEYLKLIRDGGFNSLEIFALKPHFDYQDKKQMVQLATWLTDQDGLLGSIHTPFCKDYQARVSAEWLSIANPERLRREKAVDEIRRALEFVEKVPCPLAVVHMGAPGDHFSPRHLDAIYYSLEILEPFASARGAKIALENLRNELSPVERMCRFLDDAGLRDVGICFDCGHSNLSAAPDSEIRDGGQRIVSTHLHDNHGVKDEHLLPFEGKTNWSRVLESLDAIGYHGRLVMELDSLPQPPAQALQLVRKAFDRLEQCREELLQTKAREA